ncbi:MAG: DNA repair protein RecO [Gemmatimonadaceae bacterium]|nr:DNA repair protein RecO [Chitinophagaceae bacterium]
MNIHKTKGIVLRTTKYGETSLVVSVYTEMFGIQSYLINGVRTVSKKGGSKANMYQPAALLDLIVYHNDLKNLQRIKEAKWSQLYQHIFSDVWKNAVSLYMVELLQKTIKQPEPNSDLFQFIEDAFLHLDVSDINIVANFPLYFAMHLAGFFGFRLADDYSPDKCILDLREGEFLSEHPLHPHFLENQYSYITSQLLKTMQPSELSEIKINQDTRRILINAYQLFYSLHIQDFGTMRTVPVLQAVIS